MFCTNCGNKLPDEARFCPNCGARVLPPPSGEDLVAEEPVIEEPVIEEPVIEEPVIEEPVIEEPVIEEPVNEETVETAAEAAEEIAEPVVEAAEEIAEPVVEAAEEIAGSAAGIIEDATPIAEVVEPIAETAESADEATAVSGIPEAAIPEEPPKKKKSGLIAAIVAVLIIAAGIGGYFIYQNLPSTKLTKLRTQISAAVESQDYQDALYLIEQAYEFAPDDADLRKQYVECSEAILNEKFALNDLEEFIAGADKLIEDYPEAAETLDPLVELSYESLADSAIDTGDIPTMQAIKDRLMVVHNSGRFDFSTKINWIEDNIQHVELTDLFQTLADKMLPLIKAGDRASVFETIRTEFISSGGSAHGLAPSQTVVDYHYPLYSAADEAGNRLGLYYSKGHYFFYYGPYSGTRREGNGTWICADNLRSSTEYREYWAEGPWSADKPNGTFTFSQLSKYATDKNEQLQEGTVEVKNGLYEGKVVVTYDETATLSGTCHNGIPDIIMTTDPNGKTANVVLISDDGKAWLSWSNMSKTMGIYGY